MAKKEITTTTTIHDSGSRERFQPLYVGSKVFLLKEKQLNDLLTCGRLSGYYDRIYDYEPITVLQVVPYGDDTIVEFFDQKQTDKVFGSDPKPLNVPVSQNVMAPGFCRMIPDSSIYYIKGDALERFFNSHTFNEPMSLYPIQVFPFGDGAIVEALNELQYEGYKEEAVALQKKLHHTM